ncbi:MAG: helix-turn-helix domain-containing protein [Candidatus Promineifilaceae bacterium]|nr:helix-turn-helix domain-containing protein [Candidatus Promineifilaceae bacterium]
MTEQISPSGPILRIDAQDTEARVILKALASMPRLQVLDLLKDRVLNISEIAEALDMPLSTANMHIKELEEAGLLKTELQPGTRGLQKTCAHVYHTVIVQLPRRDSEAGQALELTMPVGTYVDCDVAPTCGIASGDGIIGLFDDPASFYEPERVQAQLIWFHHGYVEYRFPNRLPPKATVDSLQLSMEICSEAPLHHDNWPSDITLWINGREIGTWTSPQDFGGQRGALTPEWWEDYNSQYGLLKVWQVNRDGSHIDGLRLSDVTLAELQLDQQPLIAVRIGVKADAKHVGGLNIFGRRFGNYGQDITMRLRYH